MANKELISIENFKKKALRNWYGSKKKVYRQCDVDKILSLERKRKSLSEYWTIANLVDYPEERKRRARMSYNAHLKLLKELHPEIKDFQKCNELKI